MTEKTTKTIGQRMAQALENRAKENGITSKQECEKLNIPYDTFRDWHKRSVCPSTYYLRKLALAGYDVYWILTGERKKNAV